MEVLSKIFDLQPGRYTLLTTKEPLVVTRLIITNVDTTTAVVNLYKSNAKRVEVNEIPLDREIEPKSSLVMSGPDSFYLTADQTLVLTTDKHIKLDLNANYI